MTDTAILDTLETIGRELEKAHSYVAAHDWNQGFIAGLEIGARCAWQTVPQLDRPLYLSELEHRTELVTYLSSLK